MFFRCATRRSGRSGSFQRRFRRKIVVRLRFPAVSAGVEVRVVRVPSVSAGGAIFGPYRTGLRRRRSLAVPYTGSCSAGLPARGAEPISGFERTAVPIRFRCAPCGTHVYTIRTRTRIRRFSSGDGADSAYAPELARMKSESVIFFRVAGVPIRSTCVSIINGSRPSTSRSRKMPISARFRSIGRTAIS